MINRCDRENRKEKTNMKNISRRPTIMLGTAARAVIGLTSFAGATEAMNNIGRAIVPLTIVNNSGSAEPAAANVGVLRGCPPRTVKHGGSATY